MTEKNEIYQQTLNDFANYLSSRDMRPTTIRVYRFSVQQFLTLYHTVNHENMMLYKCYLMERFKPQTVNLRLRAINCYVEFLSVSSPKLPMVRVQQKSFLENVISQADYEYLKACFKKDYKYSYYFIIQIMATTGMRISELLKLTVEDVRRGHINIYSKGRKSRRVYIPKSVRQDCLDWLSTIHRNRGYVFLNRYGNLITDSGVRNELKKYADRYGLDPMVVHPHAFRHLFAKNFIERCGDISMLSDILGHENIETTRIYLRRSSTEQKALINQIVNW